MNKSKNQTSFCSNLKNQTSFRNQITRKISSEFSGIFQYQSQKQNRIKKISSSEINSSVGGSPSLRVHVRSGSSLEDQKIFSDDLADVAELINKLPSEMRFCKAVRHFFDALYLRRIRNDIEFLNKRSPVKLFYKLQTNETWRSLLFFLAWVYLFVVTPLEPLNRLRTSFYTDYIFAFTIELLIFFCYFMNSILEVIHLISLNNFKKTKVFNKTIYTRIVLELICMTDFVIFYTNYPNNSLRISRLLRTFFPIFFSRELRRTFKGFQYVTNEILQFLFFYLFITVSWGLLGHLIIGDLDGEVHFDNFIENYSNFWSSLNAVFTLTTFDGFPEVLEAPLAYSKYYLLYFMPFTVLIFFILIPLPVGVLFESYKVYRSHLVIIDRLKQREALFVCFVCLDESGTKRLDEDRFVKLLMNLYHDEEIVKSLYKCLDTNNNKSLSINEFFEVLEVIESYKEFSIDNPDFYFRNWIQLKQKIRSRLPKSNPQTERVFSKILYLIEIADCVFLIIALILMNGEFANGLFFTEEVLQYLLVGNTICGILIHGRKQFFTTTRNKMQSFLLVVFIFTEIPFKKSKDSVEMLFNLIKITRTQKNIRVLRLARILVLLDRFLYKLSFFGSLKELMIRLVLCIPIIFKLLPIYIMIIFFYSIIGMEFFSKESYVRYDSPYELLHIASFNSLWHSFLTLFQVSTLAKWIMIMYDHAYKLDNLWGTALFFDSFVVISNVIVISLLKGLIWEIFMIVDEILKEKHYQRKALLVNHEKQKKAEKLDLLNDKSGRQMKILDKQMKTIFKLERKLDFSNVPFVPSCYLSSNAVDDLKGQAKKAEDNKSANYDLSENREDCDVSISNLRMQRKVMGTPSNLIKLMKQNTLKAKKKFIISSDCVDADEVSAIQPENQSEQPKLNFSPKKKPYEPSLSIERDLRRIGSESEVDNLFREKRKEIKFFKTRLKSVNFYFSQNQKREEVNQELWMHNYFALQSQDCVKNLENLLKSAFLDKKNQQNHLGIQYGTQDTFLMKMALLKDVDLKEIEKFELKYFESLFGEFFNSHTEQDLEPLLRHQSFLKHIYTSLLRYPSSEPATFTNLIFEIEKSITRKLLKLGGIFKFVFQVNENDWFYIINEKSAFELASLEFGPWGYFTDVFTEPNELFMAQDIFFERTAGDQNKLIFFLYNTFRELAVDFAQEFLSIEPKDSIWDLICFPLSRSNLRMDASLDLNSEKSLKHEIYCSRIMVVCLNFRGKGVVLEVEDDGMGESVSRREIRHLKKYPTEIKEEPSNLEDMNSYFKPESRAKAKKKSTKSTRTNRTTREPKENIIHKLEGMHTKVKRETDLNDSDSNTGLPNALVLELMKDFKDLTTTYKENFFALMDSYLGQENSNE